tara:strand:+ start:35486 stop:36667 length:1182 start_codon:yes stop_codon:yes gene_type:complete
MRPREILYISYDGILEPLGRSQVLSYLLKLSSTHNICLISYEKKENLDKEELLFSAREICREHNIKWKYFRYHKKPQNLATLYDVLKGMSYSFYLSIRRKVEIIHVRSDIAGLISFPSLVVFNKILIFDMRGFWADEKADRAGWRRDSFIYIFFKSLETKLLMISKGIITLTKDAISILIKENPSLEKEKFHVIRTCVDQDAFYYSKKRKNTGTLNIAHLGAVDTAYDIEPVVALVKNLSVLREVKIHFLNQDRHQFIEDYCIKYELPPDTFHIRSIQREEISDYLQKIHLGCFYAKKNFSIKASMPTKIGEFLSCGVPILCNNVNTDIFELISENSVGLVLDEFNDSINKINEDITELIQRDGIQEDCSLISRKYFNLEEGSNKLNRIYDTV